MAQTSRLWGGLAPGGWFHAHHRVAPDRAWARSAACSVLGAGRQLDMLTALCICMGRAGAAKLQCTCPAACLLAMWPHFHCGWLATVDSEKPGGIDWTRCSSSLFRLADEHVNLAGGRQAGIQEPGQEVASRQASSQPGRGQAKVPSHFTGL